MGDNDDPIAETSTSSFAVNKPPPDECKHVDLSSVSDDMVGDLPEPTAGVEQRLIILEKQIELISTFAQNDDDLQLAWLVYLVSSVRLEVVLVATVSVSFKDFDV